jgi:integral membrane sensor domain MASE1
MNALLQLVWLASTAALYAQQPTGIPRPQTREVSDDMQVVTTALIIIGALLLVLVSLGYIFRWDKKLFRKRRE